MKTINLFMFVFLLFSSQLVGAVDSTTADRALADKLAQDAAVKALASQFSTCPPDHFIAHCTNRLQLFQQGSNCVLALG